MQKRILGVILAVSMFLALTPDTVMAARRGGESLHIQETAERTERDTETEGGFTHMDGIGTDTAPYRIGNAEQLRIFADMVNGSGTAPNTELCAVLTHNIDLSEACGPELGSWTPIGTDTNPYTGTFDGGSFVVSGLYYHKSDVPYAGLFGCNAGTVKNLGVVGTDIEAGSYTGSVCGSNRGIITECYNTGAVKGDRYTGGVCGNNEGGGMVSICYNTGVVSGSKYVGGICGYNKNEASCCYNMGTVSGSSTSVGGICGYNRKLVSSCYNTGEVDGSNYVGSVCGYNHSESRFLNCYYLITGTEKGNYGVAMTPQQFASGEVCWLLNEGRSENAVWHQTCGVGYPIFDGKTVYQTQTYRQGGNTKEAAVAYTNDKNKREMSSRITDSAAPANSDSNSEEAADGNTDGHVYQEPEWKWKKYESATAVFTCQDCGEQLILEAEISKKEKKATCTAAGEKVYTACVDRDGRKYEDKKRVKLEKTGHRTLELLTAKPATCEEPGISMTCWICPACKKYFTDQQGTTEISRNEVVVNALGHEYVGEPEWQWEEGYSAATATFTCAHGCGTTEKLPAKVVGKETAAPTCMVEGEMVYTAVVELGGREYSTDKSKQLAKTDHNYGEPKWEWAPDNKSAVAKFTCDFCGKTVSENASVTKVESQGINCSTPGKITYTASVTVNGKTYTDLKEETIQAKHMLNSVAAKDPTCETTGNREYWECSVCHQMFGNAAGTLLLSEVPVIPATGHTLKLVKDTLYKCDVCGGTFQIITTSDGTTRIHSVEGAVITEDGNDTAVGSPNEEENEAEPVKEEADLQPDPEEEQTGEGSQNGQDGEAGEGSQRGQDGEAGEGGQSGQDESGGDIIDAPENAGRYGIIYPEGEEAGNGSMTADTWEGDAVSFHAESADRGVAQREQNGCPLWISVAVLVVLAGVVLFFVLRRKNN